MKSRQVRTLVLGIGLVFGMQACTPVKVTQGNMLPQSRVERVKVGMTKEQVERIMGTSLLTTPFSDNRWDYAYTTKLGHDAMKKKHVVLEFDNNGLLTKITQQV